MDLFLSFSVPGHPKTKGSFRAMVSRTTGKAFMLPAKKNADWQHRISLAAKNAMFELRDSAPVEVAVELRLTFKYMRPKAHFGTGKNSTVLKPNAPDYHTGQRDVDKLARSVMDGLTKIVYRDDGQVAILKARKVWASDEGADIEVYLMEERTVQHDS